MNTEKEFNRVLFGIGVSHNDEQYMENYRIATRNMMEGGHMMTDEEYMMYQGYPASYPPYMGEQYYHNQ